MYIGYLYLNILINTYDCSKITLRNGNSLPDIIFKKNILKIRIFVKFEYNYLIFDTVYKNNFKENKK